METHRYPREGEIPSPPNTSSSSGSGSSNGVLHRRSMIPSPDGNPSPTTFIQADSSSFKQVVQLLTGSAETVAKHAAPPPPPPPKTPIPPAAKATAQKKAAFKLYERRGSMKHLNMIAAAFPPRKQPEILSPSTLDFPSLVLSPVTPLLADLFNRSSPASAVAAEERAIAEKGFYLHPSPRTTPRDAEPPQLLPLFPTSSPRLSSTSGSFL